MDIKKTEYDKANYEACMRCGKDVRISMLHWRVQTVVTHYDDTGLFAEVKERTLPPDAKPLTGTTGTRALCRAHGRSEAHSYHCEGF